MNWLNVAFFIIWFHTCNLCWDRLEKSTGIGIRNLPWCLWGSTGRNTNMLTVPICGTTRQQTDGPTETYCWWARPTLPSLPFQTHTQCVGVLCWNQVIQYMEGENMWAKLAWACVSNSDVTAGKRGLGCSREDDLMFTHACDLPTTIPPAGLIVYVCHTCPGRRNKGIVNASTG